MCYNTSEPTLRPTGATAATVRRGQYAAAKINADYWRYSLNGQIKGGEFYG